MSVHGQLINASLNVSHLRVLHLLDHVYVPLSVLLSSLAAAACYAVSAVLQQSAAREEHSEHSLRPSLLLVLLRRPRWMLGNIASVAGFVFQFLALRRGALALVQPLLVVSLVIALPLGALLDHRRLTRGEVGAAVLVVSALALFLLAARPGPGDPRADTVEWVALSVLTLAVVVACLRGAGPGGPRRAVLLGAAAGVLFGVTGAVIEATGHLLDHGIAHALASWAPYGLLAATGLGVLCNQSAYQVGELRWSLPVITVLEPLVGIAIGEFMFGEHIATSALARSGEAIGLIGMVFGVFALAHPRVGTPASAA